jgi:SpoVK/Ycf46/Vps4 family AAA+-type ATPase
MSILDGGEVVKTGAQKGESMTKRIDEAAAEAAAPRSTAADMKPPERFRFLLKAREALIWFVSDDERRAEAAIAVKAAGAGAGYRTIFWDCATLARDLEGNAVEIPKGPIAAQAVLSRIAAREGREVWVLRDYDAWIGRDARDGATTIRALKTLVRKLQDERDSTRFASIVILTGSSDVPVGLRSSINIIEWPLPDRSEVGATLEDIAKIKGDGILGSLDDAVDAAMGLTIAEIEKACAFSLATIRKIDPSILGDQKKRVIEREKVLRLYPREERGLDALGGLELLKEWLMQMRHSLTPAARQYGLPAPKGVLLIGPPGGGKSFTARALAAAWGLPLLRLDFGALKGSFVGQSETNIRRALDVAARNAPIVLWVDEIEKALAGAQSRGDSGVSADALGTFLTWMQDHQEMVFTVATANAVDQLPPELLRKGRFNDIFFIDLPTQGERAAILAATIISKGRNPEKFDLFAIASQTEGFSGAELAELMNAAMLAAFSDNRREPSTDDLLLAALATTPLSETAAEKITALRAWAKGRTRRASLPESQIIESPTGGGRFAAVEMDN